MAAWALSDKAGLAELLLLAAGGGISLYVHSRGGPFYWEQFQEETLHFLAALGVGFTFWWRWQDAARLFPSYGAVEAALMECTGLLLVVTFVFTQIWLWKWLENETVSPWVETTQRHLYLTLGVLMIGCLGSSWILASVRWLMGRWH